MTTTWTRKSKITEYFDRINRKNVSDLAAKFDSTDDLRSFDYSCFDNVLEWYDTDHWRFTPFDNI